MEHATFTIIDEQKLEFLYQELKEYKYVIQGVL